MSPLISEEAFNVLMGNPFEMKNYEEFIKELQKTIRDAVIDATGISDQTDTVWLAQAEIAKLFDITKHKFAH